MSRYMYIKFLFVGVVFAKNDSGLWKPDIVVYNNSCLNTTTVVFNQAPDDFDFRNYRVFVTDQDENPTKHVSVPYMSALSNPSIKNVFERSKHCIEIITSVINHKTSQHLD